MALTGALPFLEPFMEESIRRQQHRVMFTVRSCWVLREPKQSLCVLDGLQKRCSVSWPDTQEPRQTGNSPGESTHLSNIPMQAHFLSNFMFARNDSFFLTLAIKMKMIALRNQANEGDTIYGRGVSGGNIEESYKCN